MINILFGGNHKVFDGILLCVLSILKHYKGELHIYILSADVKELNPDYIPFNQKQIELLNNIIKKENPNSTVSLKILDSTFNDWISSSSNKLNSYTPFAFLRLFADKVEDLPEKIIYFDTDIMINNNIEELFNIDISNHEVGVVLDRYGRFFIKPNYFNSGMLLMNLKKIKETNLLEKVRNLCGNKKMSFPDQTALNKFCKHKLYLPRKFNEQGNTRKDTVVQHFSKRFSLIPFFHTINIKPWQIDLLHKKYNCYNYDDIYEKYTKIKQENNL